MQIKIIAVGTKMPNWVNDGFTEYSRRLPRECQINLIEIPAEKRRKSTNLKQVAAIEGKQMLAAISPNDYVIALERHGKTFDTLTFANRLADWQQNNQNLSLLIGGPEGLAPECLQKSQTIWSLSALTLPHPLVRVILAEQIYRAFSILSHHPYHR